MERKWIEGLTALLDEYVALQENPIYWDIKEGFPLRVRKLELERNFAEMSPRWLRALLSENAQLTKLRQSMGSQIIAGRETVESLQKLIDKSDKKIYCDDVEVILDAYRNNIELAKSIVESEQV